MKYTIRSRALLIAISTASLILYASVPTSEPTSSSIPLSWKYKMRNITRAGSDSYRASLFDSSNDSFCAAVSAKKVGSAIYASLPRDTGLSPLTCFAYMKAHCKQHPATQ